MYEISKRFFGLAAIAAIMFFGSVAFQGHTAVATNGGDSGHVAILQQPGAAGHMQIAFGAESSSGCGRMVMSPMAGMGLVYSDNQTTGNIAVLSAKAGATSYNYGTMAAILRQAQIQARAGTGTIYNGTMALMRETWQTETNSGGFGHRLSQARQAQGDNVTAQMAHLEESYSRRA